MTPHEVLLKAARKAYPEFIWREEDGMILGALRKSIEALGDSARYMAPEQLAPYFNAKFSIESGNCGMALQIALEAQENGGWTFWRTYDGTFVAESWDESKILHAPTKPDLLLAIVREGV